jgi:hypothetical protein
MQMEKRVLEFTGLSERFRVVPLANAHPKLVGALERRKHSNSARTWFEYFI